MGFLKRNILRISIPAIVVIGLAVYFWRLEQQKPPQFVTKPATRGAVIKSIITTGAVNPVVTVQVGSYVSGVIQALYCDYNTHVKAGQLCAKIDPRPYQLVVDQDAANLASAKAQLAKDRASLDYAKTNYQRDLNLLKEGVVSQDTVDSDKSVYDQGKAQIALDQATIRQHQAALNGARVNLSYTDIVSPVDGVVISRSIDVGQTVAASFQTPTLFLIGKDLTKMQVDTNVSESDVGGAKVGDKASFTVEAYPKKTFEGRVTEVRQAPITVQNVVTYDAVIGVDNPERLLLPGMTANAKIVTEERNDVLRVPQQALRFEPQGLPAAGGNAARSARPGARVWILKAGQPVAMPVSVGLEDGTWAEITGGGLAQGDAVITDESTAGAAAARRPTRTPFRL